LNSLENTVFQVAPHMLDLGECSLKHMLDLGECSLKRGGRYLYEYAEYIDF